MDNNRLRVLAGIKVLNEALKLDTEKQQLAAVKRDGNVIRFIKKPSEKVQIAAIKQNKSSIKHIKKPTKLAMFFATEPGKVTSIKPASKAIQAVKVPFHKFTKR